MKKLLIVMIAAVLSLGVFADDAEIFPFDTSRFDTDGEGVVIAFIDSGFFTDDPHMTVSEGKKLALSASDIESVLDELSLPEDAEYSSIGDKIPFAYDYFDSDSDTSSLAEFPHGQQLANLAVGNSEDFRGIAPEAQMLAMKVFSDDGTLMSMEALANAVRDAVIIGADIINISIGEYSGFSGDFSDRGVADALAFAEENGVLVIASAGNVPHVGGGSEYANIHGIPLPLAGMNDSGAVCYPSTVDTVLSVGSYEDGYSVSYAITTADGYEFLYTDTNITYNTADGKMFVEVFEDSEVPYVLIDGLGDEESFADAGDLAGKIALIMRGVLPFAEKVNNAAKFGAAGVIIYDNVEDGEPISMDLTGAEIPAIFVSREDGLVLASAKNKTLIIADGGMKIKKLDAGEHISDFSAWGPVHDLSMKPEILAVGETVGIPNSAGVYSLVDGTSASSAFCSGISALMIGERKANGTEYTPSSIRMELMSTAVPFENEGIELSPRAQGAGKIDPAAAISPETVVYLENGDAKAELGELSDRIFEFTASIENRTAVDKEYRISMSVMRSALEEADIDGKTEYFLSRTDSILEKARVYAGDSSIDINRNSDKFGLRILKLKANSKTSVKITVVLDRDELPEKEEFYIEGYLSLHNADGVREAGIPYMGYYGNWADLPIFDSAVYNSSYFYYGGGFVGMDIKVGGVHILGESEDGYFEKFAAFSPNGDGLDDFFSFRQYLFRNAVDLSYSIISEDGETVYTSETLEYAYKDVLAPTGVTGLYLPGWDGTAEDNPEYIYPDGIYRIVIKAKPAFKNAKEQSVEYSIAIDTEKPKLISTEVKLEEGKKMLYITLKDNMYIKETTVYTAHTAAPGGITTTHSTPSDIECGEEYPFAVDITAADREAIYIEANDYAGNSVTFKVSI